MLMVGIFTRSAVNRSSDRGTALEASCVFRDSLSTRSAARCGSSAVAALTCSAAESSVRVDAVETRRSPRSTAATSSDAPLLSTLVARWTEARLTFNRWAASACEVGASIDAASGAVLAHAVGEVGEPGRAHRPLALI